MQKRILKKTADFLPVKYHSAFRLPKDCVMKRMSLIVSGKLKTSDPRTKVNDQQMCQHGISVYRETMRSF